MLCQEEVDNLRGAWQALKNYVEQGRMDEGTGQAPGKGKCLSCLSGQGSGLYKESAQRGK